jgi:class 3 adenylate cyclase/tetratricopeptide (TPR) repeat protein
MPEERRVVTILFADVTGSTALGETTDPEDTRAVLGRYYAIAREVVAEHGGTLEKFIGDAVMAVFGMPTAHGDDAERALAAALALRDRVASDAHTATLALRIGVNTGEVVATREASGGDFLITGDAVNIAARLQQHAEPGAILVGERTGRAVTGFRFTEAQRITVKGKREPIVGSVLSERSADRRVPRAPFLGRENDLAQLELTARRAFSERRPQLVTITAPAGTGKSRLVEEFAARLPRRDVTVATAQCLPYGSAVTFLPLQGLVRGLLRIGRDADFAPALRDAFASGGYSGDDARRLAGLVGVTLGDAGDSERSDRDEIFSAWRLLVEVLAAKGPLLVIFEDLHWASDTLLDLVEHITVSRTSAPLVMVALARPELLDRRPHWGGGRRSFTSIGLEPLSAEETLRLVNVLTEGVPGAIAAAIVERAGGNPFFLGELVRAYEDRRRAGAADDEIRLPDSVHATVLARIDGLPATERTVLEFAAVTGRTARVASLAALLPEPGETAIGAALEALAERDLLVAQGAGAYTFRHIVIREVAYATLPRAERVLAHLRLATWFEQQAPQSGDRFAELVAYHYRQAIALSPGGKPPQGLRVEVVVRALEVAARAAWNAGAFAEAGQQIREAIRIAPAEDHLRLYELLGDVMQFGDAAVDGYREAFERWQAAPGDPRVGARLMVKRLGVYARWSGSLSRPLLPAEMLPLTEEATALLARGPDPLTEARLAMIRAFRAGGAEQLTDRDKLTELATGAMSARRVYAERRDAAAESEALDALASLYRSGFGDCETALGFARDRIAMSDRLELLERADAWNVAVWDLTYLGRYEEAIRTCAEARGTLRPGEPESFFSHAVSWAAYSAMLCGRWDDTVELCDWLVQMREEVGAAIGRFTISGWLAGLRVAASRIDTTRLARYRSTFAAIADVASLPSKSPAGEFYRGILEGDARSYHRFLLAHSGYRDRKGEAIAMLLFDHRENVRERELASIEQQALHDPPALTLRVALARALRSGADKVRAAVALLDANDLIADAARTQALLALRTHELRDREDAERRLTALGDRQYLQVLAEEW